MSDRVLIAGSCIILCALLFQISALDHAREQWKKSAALTTPYWKLRIAQVGPAKAQEEMVTLLADQHPQLQHVGGHAYGGALYAITGTSSMRTCGKEFSWACIHGLMIGYTHDEGVANISLLTNACAHDWNCLHGIGHGLIAELGYDPTVLESALTICGHIPDEVGADACRSGIFMGYNLHVPPTDKPATFAVIENEQRRITGNPLEPCDTLSQATYTCYYWQSQVWNNSWRKDFSADQIAVKMGGLCSNLAGKNRTYCFAGIGYTVPAMAQYDPNSITRLCDMTSSIYSDSVLCRTFAARMLGIRVSREKARLVCDNMTEKAHLSCLRDLEGDYVIPTRFDE